MEKLNNWVYITPAQAGVFHSTGGNEMGTKIAETKETQSL